MRHIFFWLVSLVFVETTHAHHSNAPHFDTDVEVTLNGTVTEWRFVNPHAFLYFDVQNEDGTLSKWRCETDAASGLRKRNYSAETFIIGEAITVTGNPARREANHCFFRDVVFADGSVVNRNTDMASLNRGSQTEGLIAPQEAFTAVLFGGEPDISGYWWDGEETITTGNAGFTPPQAMGNGMGMGVPTNGDLPPRLARIANIGLTNAGQEIQDSYERIYDDPALHCQISNIIDALGRDESVNEIRQNGDTITIRYGYMDYLRTIYLNMNEHPEVIEPTPGGHSIGRWEGDTLIVDTLGFTPSVLNAQVGAPTSEAFHVIERITLNSFTGELDRQYTATDAKNWTDSYEGQDSYRRSRQPYSPYNCETLSGLNNLRPGTPEYDAELARQSVSEETTAQTNDETVADLTNDSQDVGGTRRVLLIAFFAMLFLSAFFVVRRK